MSYSRRYSRYFEARWPDLYGWWGQEWLHWRSFDRYLPYTVALVAQSEIGPGNTPFSYYSDHFSNEEHYRMVKRLDRYYRARMPWRQWGDGQTRCTAKRAFNARIGNV